LSRSEKGGNIALESEPNTGKTETKTLKRTEIMDYSHVFKPLRIGPLTAKNRIEVSPAEPMLASHDGFVTPEFIAFTQRFALGGAAIVTVGDSPVTSKYASSNRFVIDLTKNEVVHGLYSLTDAIHRYGAIASIELNVRDERLPSEFTAAEIDRLIEDFASAADRCRRAGFDMVMIHGGHGHTVSSFYSPANTRSDKYGCRTMEDRCRFASDLLDAVREKIGPNMAIEWRISGDELRPGGVGPEEAVRFAQYIQNKIDMIQVSAGGMFDRAASMRMIQPTYLPRATNLYLAEAFKKELDIPVCSVGSFNMELAEQAVAEGKADMVAMIRTLIADPMAVRKCLLGHGERVRPCIRCGVCTGGPDPHAFPLPLRCAVNPLAGRESLFSEYQPAIHTRKVLIVGGGCAGMEAARWLAIRGHRPVIIEKSGSLGGSLIAAGANPLKSDIKEYTKWAVRETEHTPGIGIRLNTEVTREIIEAEYPDAIIIATGSKPYIPDIPGIESDHVVLAGDVDHQAAEVGKEVVVAGAGLTGTETAVSLAKSGHSVTLIDMLALERIDASSKVPFLTRSIRHMAGEAGVRVIEKVKLQRVLPDAVILEDENGNELRAACDTLVLALGVRPAAIKREEYEGIVKDVYFVGDCHTNGGTIADAVREGFYAAMNIR
jgi:2,4-dienoyl-CoA reductase-like NADH-dependent reductase (Old Yellow Enzyme family)/NADPH-dependent 2,4-dienoyl-CoA reductase/sulfur reductase-like enzyme